MKLAGILTCIVAAFVLVMFSMYPATSRTAPAFGWAATQTEAFTLNAGDRRAYSIPPDVGTNIKIAVRAESAVNFGFVPASLVETVGVSGLNGKVFDCGDVNVLATEKVCKASTPQTLVFADSRTMEAAVLGAALIDRSAIARATVPNKISVTFFKWKCIANCL